MKEDQERLEKLKDATNASPYYHHMGLKVNIIGEDGSSELVMNFKDNFRNIHGIAHGGVLASLVDACSGLALYSLLKEDEAIVTVDLRINYVAPFTEGKITGRGKAIHRGRNTAVSEGSIYDESEKLLAKGMATYFIHKR